MTLADFREERARGKRRAVLDAATVLFAEQGLGAVTMANLAAAAGVSTATLYRHFADKEEVFACVIDELVSGFGRADTSHQRSTLSPHRSTPDGLYDLSLRYVRLLVDPTVLGLLRAVVADRQHGSGFRHRLDSHGNAILLKDFERAIGAAFQDARTPAQPERITQASLELRGALEHISLVPGLLFHETPSDESLIRQVGRIVESWRHHWLGG